MADMMPADQAAKVLLKYRATGRITERLVPAIDAAVAALEELKGARLALSAAKTALAAKDAAYALQSKEWDALQEKARTLDSERQANAILTEENDRLRARLEGMARIKRTTEWHIAMREAHQIHDGDAYFAARPGKFNVPRNRDLFEAGYQRGFDAGEKVYAAAPVAEGMASAKPVGCMSRDQFDAMTGGTVENGEHFRIWQMDNPPSRARSGVKLYAAPQPAYCCAKCGLAEIHPRERALHKDAKRGNFRSSAPSGQDGITGVHATDTIPAAAIVGDDDGAAITQAGA